MNYKQEWDDMKIWLVSGIVYLSEREIELRKEGKDVNEHIRVKAKLDGLANCLQHMQESEKLSKR